MTPAEKIQLGYYLVAALSFIAGMVIMAVARVERGDLDEEENIDMMEDEEEW